MKVNEDNLLEMYRDDIDNSIELIDIWGMKYEPSRVLEEVDPIAFRVGFSDWLDSQEDCEDCDLNPIECTCDPID